MVSRAVRAGEPPTMGTFPLQANGYTWDEWTAPIAATSVAFFENGNLSAMKGVFLTRRKDPDFRERVRGDKLVFLPFVDGTFSATLRDVNDFHLMERGVCLGLKGEAGCGTPHVW